MIYQTKKRGFTLIETLVGTTIFVLIAFSAYKAFGILMDAVESSRAKIAATSLANERLEIIRNLPYGDVGIIAGLPTGKIERTQNILRDRYSFNIQTTIRNIDDPFDGTIDGNPTDYSPADYKLVDLDITCSNCKFFSPLKFTTLVSPHALETASTNGALFIKVFDTAGLPISNAQVHIENTQINPNIIIDETTDNEGWIKIIDVPPGVNTYNIRATKSGFSQDETYPAGGVAGQNPIKPNATVALQQITQEDFLIDKVSSLNVKSIDSSCEALPNINFSLTGTKLIGTPSVLKYQTQNFSTNSGGEYLISNLEWDSYKILSTSSSYDLVGSNPFINFALNPNENKNIDMIIVPHIEKALLIFVKDTDGNPINGASVQLKKGLFDENKITNSNLCSTPGQVFWNGLSNGTHNITISKEGYQTAEDSININSSWQNKEIILDYEIPLPN